MNIIYSKDVREMAEKEIVVSKECEVLIETLLLVDQLPKTVSLKIRLAGRGSRVEIVILYFGRNKDEIDMTITLIHEAPETYGRVILKAALFDQSRLTFRGMLDIKEHAKGADSYLLAKALVLSPSAKAEIYPYLEIKTDEVKASHGSSIGAIDERALFYLMSRDITKERAQNILLAEFFRDVAGELPKQYQKQLFQI